MSTPDPEVREPELPPRPERPDCCLGGCAVCVLDGYPEEVEAWERRVAEIRAQWDQRTANAPDSPAHSR